VLLSNPKSTLDLASLASLEKAPKLCAYSTRFLTHYSDQQTLSPLLAGKSINLQLQLPRLLALLATAVFTERAFFNPSQRDFSPKFNRNRLNLRRLAIGLQIVWVLSEVVFSSAFAPLLLAVVPSLALSSSGSIALGVLPVATMAIFAGCIEFFSKIRHRGGRHRRLSSVNSEDFEHLTAANSSKYPSQAGQRQHPYQHNYLSDMYSTPPLSPAGSSASGSSGALASGLPSPTGHCPSPDRAAILRCAATMQETHGNKNKKTEDIPSAKNIFLKEHSGLYLETTNDSMLFVHKILRPIKTRIDDQEPVRSGDYIPLLQQLMAQSQSQKQNKNHGSTKATARAVMNPSPPLFQPAVVATISLGKKKESTVMRTNQPPVPIPVFS
jgi:hypothetical protein